MSAGNIEKQESHFRRHFSIIFIWIENMYNSLIEKINEINIF